MEGQSATMRSMQDELDYVSDGAPADDAEARGSDPSGFSAEPDRIEPMQVVEAVLFASDSPMPAAKIAAILDVGDAKDVRRHIEALNARYAEGLAAFRIEEVAGGYQMMTLPVYNHWLAKLLRARQESRLSQAAMETLAIVAYRQPCTRAEIETIRGVAAGDMLNRLREMNLVKIVGRAEDLGRPLLYGTTKRFLEVFGLPSLEDLPQVGALGSGAAAAAGLNRARAEAVEVAATTDDGAEGGPAPEADGPDKGPRLRAVDPDEEELED